MLRLEHLFDRLGQLLPRTAAVDHHFALVTLFEIMDVASRADLKSDLLKELERHKAQLMGYRSNPNVSQAALDSAIAQIDHAHGGLNQQTGKAVQALANNDWLMAIRSRAVIPAGTCSFDLPAYHAWQHRPAAARRDDLQGWTESLAPMAQAVMLLLQILRDSGRPQKVMAAAGQFQQTLPQNRAFQLLRLRIDESMQLIPEISGNRLVASVRLMRQDADGKLQLAREDAPFELALCA